MELHHVVSGADWDVACKTGQHSPPALQRDGFLHCCTSEQLKFVLARHFAGVADVLVLTFETDEVPARLTWVKSEPDQAPFPHLYGAIPRGSIRRATPPD